jgi:hypothetical protein
MTSDERTSLDQWRLFRHLCRLVAGRAASHPRDDAERGCTESLCSLAAERRVLPALAVRLCHEETPEAVPGPATAQHLRQALLLNTRRNMQITAQALKLARSLNRAGIIPLFLKGTALLLATPRTPLGFRWQLDIDLIVPPGQLAQASRSMLAEGYRFLAQPAGTRGGDRAAQGGLAVHGDSARAIYESRHHHHLPPMIKESYESPVELHKSHLPRRFQDNNPVGPLFSGARLQRRQDAEFLLPAINDQIIQLVLGTFLHDGYAARYDLCLRADLDYCYLLDEPTQWTDTALLQQRCGAALAIFDALVIELMGFRPSHPIRDPADVRWRLGIMKHRMNSPGFRQLLDGQARIRHLGRSLLSSSGKLPTYLRRNLAVPG